MPAPCYMPPIHELAETVSVQWCCEQYFWTQMGMRQERDGQFKFFTHRHYPDGFVLPVHYDTVPD